jgi:septal ring factor EnvC (AmiA/AmiB activator)
MSTLTTKLKLPQIEKVKLQRFSLYTANPNAEFSCSNGVLCLVGANGIGKSTLLSAINYCLTGMVSDPNRAFKSMEEYYNFTRGFTSNYFRGRIHGSDEEDAEISLSFRLGTLNFEIRRGMFEPDELRGLTITKRSSNETVLATDEMSRSERNRAYVAHFVKHSNVSSFEEFAFLQHFVFSFDEQRKTLFWNHPIMERVLYRAFGLKPDMAKQVDTIRREIDKWDSDVRNRQWDATRLRRRINEIQSKAQAIPGAQQTYESLVTDHEALSKQFDQESQLLRELENALKDTNLLLAQHSMRETGLRDEYANFFDRSFNLRPPLSEHPLITQSLSDQTCGLCGSEDSAALSAILTKSKKTICPLCDSSLNQEPQTEEDVSRLREIDKELAEAKHALRDVLQTLKGLSAEESKMRLQWTATKEKLDEFNRQNSATLEGLRNLLNQGNATASLSLNLEQLAAFEKEKDEAYEQREKLKEQLISIQRGLEGSYLQVEKDFVSKFEELAHQFLGMPLTVQLDAREASGPKLIVSVRGTTRREQQQLSESQRFFLDIALRMALTQHMSDPSSRGGMFIDTPEGSLDIAYEKRAGDMLARFAEAGHQIIMTANLNSSQLLLALARNCGRANMQLCRMTDWAELTTVQQEEAGLFNMAYAAIETAMST